MKQPRIRRTTVIVFCAVLAVLAAVGAWIFRAELGLSETGGPNSTDAENLDKDFVELAMVCTAANATAGISINAALKGKNQSELDTFVEDTAADLLAPLMDSAFKTVS